MPKTLTNCFDSGRFNYLMLSILVCYSCNNKEANTKPYTSSSSQIILTGHEKILEGLPDNPLDIAELASKQMIHHNCLAALNVVKSSNNVRSPFPPDFSSTLGKLETIEPYQLSLDRNKENRLIGACVTESYFLAGLLRAKNIPVRIRAGYFKNSNKNAQHFIDFWEGVAKYRGFSAQLLIDDSVAWKENQNAYNKSQLDADHHIEHWICEYWNKEKEQWILLDANNDFIKLSSNIDVGYELPKHYFQYAHEAWISMRADNEYDPAKHEEYPQDGRSHIRSQLITDFYNLLNHDISCYSNIDSASKDFVKKKKYEELSDLEVSELDDLASVLATDPSISELITFYNNSATLKIESAKMDIYSFLSLYED